MMKMSNNSFGGSNFWKGKEGNEGGRMSWVFNVKIFFKYFVGVLLVLLLLTL